MVAFMTIEKWLQSERFYYVILPNSHGSWSDTHY